MLLTLLSCRPGWSIEEAEVPHEMTEPLALRIYTIMVQLQTMDVVFYDAQRQVLSLSILPR